MIMPANTAATNKCDNCPFMHPKRLSSYTRVANNALIMGTLVAWAKQEEESGPADDLFMRLRGLIAGLVLAEIETISIASEWTQQETKVCQTNKQ